MGELANNSAKDGSLIESKLKIQDLIVLLLLSVSSSIVGSTRLMALRHEISNCYSMA